jgi:class 3 adenylate cyclase
MVAPAPQTYTPAHLAEKILTSKAALEGQRKQVTVLFADLKGSMELLAERDPEEARAILDPVLERMMAAAHPRSQQASAAAQKPGPTAVPGVRGFALD